MSEYPNLLALTKGGVSGRISEWPSLKTEAINALDELQRCKNALKIAEEVLKLYGDSASWDCDFGRSQYDLLFTKGGYQFGIGHGWEHAKKALAEIRKALNAGFREDPHKASERTSKWPDWKTGAAKERGE